MIILKYFIFIFFCFTLSVNSAALSSEASESSLNVTNLPIAGKQISTTQQALPKRIIKAEEKTISKKSIKEAGLALPVSQTLPQTESISFGHIFFRMLKALFGIIFLILVITGLILLFKRLRVKMAAQKLEEHKAASVEGNAAPSTISEAVASFVRHRLK